MAASPCSWHEALALAEEHAAIAEEAQGQAADWCTKANLWEAQARQSESRAQEAEEKLLAWEGRRGMAGGGAAGGATAAALAAAPPPAQAASSNVQTQQSQQVLALATSRLQAQAKAWEQRAVQASVLLAQQEAKTATTVARAVQEVETRLREEHKVAQEDTAADVKQLQQVMVLVVLCCWCWRCFVVVCLFLGFCRCRCACRYGRCACVDTWCYGRLLLGCCCCCCCFDVVVFFRLWHFYTPPHTHTPPK
jgi:hypothetical protein